MKKPSVGEGRAVVEGEREALRFDVDVGAAAAAGGGSYRARLVGDAVVLGRLGAVVAIVAVFLRLARGADGRPRHRAGGGLAHFYRTAVNAFTCGIGGGAWGSWTLTINGQ